MSRFSYTWLILIVLMSVTSNLWARKSKHIEVKVPLTEKGIKLESKYTKQLDSLKQEILKVLPKFDEKIKSNYIKATNEEQLAKVNADAKKAALKKNKSAVGLLNHRKGWIGRAIKSLAEAKESLKTAKSMSGDSAEKVTALKTAEEALVKIQKNYDAAADALGKAEVAFEKAKLEEPKLTNALNEAEEKFAIAQENTMQLLKNLDVHTFLSNDEHDAKFLKYSIMFQATPKGLAEFAQLGEREEKLLEMMFSNTKLMKQMLIADGARNSKYGKAMKIYTDIQKVSIEAKEGVLQRLALAIALVHAVPISSRNPKGETDGPAIIDPIKRYQHFKNAYINGDLDPAFKVLKVWDYRMVVDGNEPDVTHSWGREMLSNYRPDHITTPDYRWRYVKAVKTEVKYGSKDNKYDKPELQFFQNILMNGGICGRRAFFGRFMLRSFGVPTTARPQPGHAALAHWTPKGWVVCLGGGWGIGTTKTFYKKDRDFLATTQAREKEKLYEQVKRAQWIGDVLGENRTYGFLSSSKHGFWNGLSLYRQREIIEEINAVALAAVGTDIGEANESKVKDVIEKIAITEEDRTIVISKEGVITIPAVACSKPLNSTAKIIFMKSNLGGKQLHYSRLGKNHEEFEYTFEAPTAGAYSLTSRLVTPTWKQNLLLSVNGSKELIDIATPFTVGLWGKTEPVLINLTKGKNVLTFSRTGETKGITIKDFTLSVVN